MRGALGVKGVNVATPTGRAVREKNASKAHRSILLGGKMVQRIQVYTLYSIQHYTQPPSAYMLLADFRKAQLSPQRLALSPLFSPRFDRLTGEPLDRWLLARPTARFFSCKQVLSEDATQLAS